MAGKSVHFEALSMLMGNLRHKNTFAVYSDWKDSMKEHAETLVNGNT